MQTTEMYTPMGYHINSLTPQASKVLGLLRKGKLTRLIAMHYGVMNITARLADLRRFGYKVECHNKRDSEGNRYGEFHLVGSA